ncbi:MAG: DUF2332 domain-containing protein [Hyphomonadaceae bacterium]
MNMREKILAHFAEQAMYCDMFGSPFTAQLIKAMSEDYERGGPSAALLKDWTTSPRADALALRLAGYFHHAVLANRDPELAAHYPSNLANWSIDDIWPLARALLEREPNAAAQFIRSAPQTNETRRSIALLAAFLTFAQTWPGEIDMLEIGASAGLNMNWDLYTYKTKSWTWGVEGPVQITTDWHGSPPPIEAGVNLRHRAACDLNPLDIGDDADRLQLKSYIWPDQPERLARFDGAVALARETGVHVERADAAEWLSRKLAQRAGDAATIVYHSVFLQYPPREARAAIVDAIASAGARASASAPLAWVRLEPEALTDNVRDSPRMVIDITTWPGARRRIIGYTDGHVRAVHA